MNEREKSIFIGRIILCTFLAVYMVACFISPPGGFNELKKAKERQMNYVEQLADQSATEINQ